MKSLALAISFVAAGVVGASAADLAARPYTKAPPPLVATAYDWTGFYVGGSVGGHQTRDRDPASFGTNSYFGTPDDIAAAAAWPFSQNGSGFAGGVQAGYNWQFTNIVLGVEADIMGLSGSISRSTTFPENGGADIAFVNDHVRNNWMSTIRGRAGVAADRALFYVTGGVAFANFSINHSFSDTAGPSADSVSGSTPRTGWTVGGGIEYALNANWTLRGEYLYADFGTANSTLLHTDFGIFTVLHGDHLTENVGRIGLNYKWGGPVVAKY
jgi:outer membrane immunogenic protein